MLITNREYEFFKVFSRKFLKYRKEIFCEFSNLESRINESSLNNVGVEYELFNLIKIKEFKYYIFMKWTKDDLIAYDINHQKGCSHIEFILNGLTHRIANLLESGRFHVYRGVLGNKGLALREALNFLIQDKS